MRFILVMIFIHFYKISSCQDITLNEFVNFPNKSSQQIIDLMTSRNYRIFQVMADTSFSRLGGLYRTLQVRTSFIFVDNRMYKDEDGFSIWDNMFQFTFMKFCENKTFVCDPELFLRGSYSTYTNETQFSELTDRLWREDFEVAANRNESYKDRKYFVRRTSNSKDARYYELEISSENYLNKKKPHLSVQISQTVPQ